MAHLRMRVNIKQQRVDSLGRDGPLTRYGQAVHDRVLAVVLVQHGKQEVDHHWAVLAPLGLHLVGLDVSADEAGSSAGQQPVGLEAGPGDVVHVAVVGEELEQEDGAATTSAVSSRVTSPVDYGYPQTGRARAG